MSRNSWREAIRWTADGLVPVVAQDERTGDVLMLAWANAEAIQATLDSGFAHYFSRSRQALWKKGESSGHLQAIVAVRLDCDGDTVLYRVRQQALACHTGRRSCFFREITADGVAEIADLGPLAADTPPLDMLERVYAVIQSRKSASGERSYVKSLLDGGLPKMLAKVAEEADEVAEAFHEGDRQHIRHEIADLLFHLLVAQASIDLPPDAVRAELSRRFGVSGHDEKASRKP